MHSASADDCEDSGQLGVVDLGRVETRAGEYGHDAPSQPRRPCRVEFRPLAQNRLDVAGVETPQAT